MANSKGFSTDLAIMNMYLETNQVARKVLKKYSLIYEVIALGEYYNANFQDG